MLLYAAMNLSRVFFLVPCANKVKLIFLSLFHATEDNSRALRCINFLQAKQENHDSLR